ncbi:deleted in malignant brain tumors 1 protein-like [Gigantopelta aegis]|uniref:deleted in malignant brain tumors 1 protein-like n=1 Tax=Gigantopelta aegis TaxID=1735272 RepID=UPI001B88E789|nr:deleted in malignant brain tumors 1 protein-like [Gigantopelta aegis]
MFSIGNMIWKYGLLLILFLIYSSFAKNISSDSTCFYNLTANSTLQTFTSPGYPNHYNNNERCGWLIETESSNLTIKADLVKCRTEGTDYDFISVYDGPDRNSTRIALWGGTFRTTSTVHSSGNRMYVSFQSDSSTRNQGFVIRYYQSNNADSTCFYDLTANSTVQTFTSPGYPNFYDNNERCGWLIEAESSNLTIKADLVECRTEGTDYDFISVYDGPDRNSTRIALWGGTVRNTLTVHSSGNRMYVSFQSDRSITNRGFVIRYYQSNNADSTCFYNLTANSTVQTFTSPGYPNSYDNNERCGWLIEAESSNLTIKADLVECRTEGTDYDFISVYDGSDRHSTRIALWGGTVRNTLTVHSSGNRMYVAFQSDSSIINRGFVIRYYQSNNADSTCFYNLTANSTVQTFTSPGYPNFYDNNERCGWLIDAESSNLTITADLVECRTEGTRYDFISVYDGPDRNSTRIALWGGTVQNTLTVRSSGNRMYVSSQSDRFITNRGFVIRYYQSNNADYNCQISPRARDEIGITWADKV